MDQAALAYPAAGIYHDTGRQLRGGPDDSAVAYAAVGADHRPLADLGTRPDPDVRTDAGACRDISFNHRR